QEARIVVPSARRGGAGHRSVTAPVAKETGVTAHGRERRKRRRNRLHMAIEGGKPFARGGRCADATKSARRRLPRRARHQGKPLSAPRASPLLSSTSPLRAPSTRRSNS